MLKSIALKLKIDFNYYYTPAIKCVVDKKPTLKNIVTCNSFLKEEVEIIKPRFIMVVGVAAFKALLWDFNLITRRKAEVESCAGAHINKDGIIYFPIEDLSILKDKPYKTQNYRQNIAKFIKLTAGQIKITPVDYKEVESEKELSYIYNTAKETGRVSVDIECNSLTPFLPESEILTVSLCVKKAEAFCLPLSFRNGTYFKKWDFVPKVNPLHSLIWLNKILKHNKITKIFHNAKFDMLWLETFLGYRINNVDDTMLMKYLLNQSDQERKSLKSLIKTMTDMGYYEYNIKQYVGDGESYSNIPPNLLMEYNNGDVDGTLRIHSKLKKKLIELKLDKVLYDFLLPKIRGIIELQKDGVALDLKRCATVQEESLIKLAELKSKLREIPQIVAFEKLVGLEFNPKSPKHKFAMVYGEEITTNEEVPRPIIKGKKKGKKILKKAYYNGFKLEPILISRKDPKTGKREKIKSFGREAIQKLLKSMFKEVEYLEPINTFQLDAIPDNSDLVKYIKLVSSIGTISTQLSNHIEPFINIWGRTLDKCVHTSYDATGTSTGRLNSRDPNLQNLKRDGFVKEAFISRWGKDGVLIEADYKQLELFVMAIVSQDPLFVHAFTNGIDLHKKVAANIVFRVAEEAVTKQMRTAAKTVNFGIIYGKTAYSLAEDLNVSVEKAEQILREYFEEYIGVKVYCDRVKAFARKNGYVQTVMGRRRYIDYSDESGADRQAVNTCIQSPASDVCLTALNMLSFNFAKSNVAKVCGTVHDSIWIDCKKQYINEIVEMTKLIMENTGLPWITIPLKVDIKYGPNLRDMTEWTEGEIITV
jgi:uracil-DNA glycosylase family 4